jgi:glycosidase
MDLVVNHSSDEHDCSSSLDLLEITNIAIITIGGRKKENHYRWSWFDVNRCLEVRPNNRFYYLLFFRKQPDLNWENRLMIVMRFLA